MLKLLVGPVLMGAGYAAGSYYGRDSEQLVHKSPSVTHAAMEDALAGVRDSGTTSFEGGTPMPYELKIERTFDQRLVVSLFFAGQQGAQADIDFTPQDGGKDTLITARIHSDHAVLRPALAGTSKARLAYAPDWMLNLAMRPVLKQLADQIEQGGTAGNALQEWTPADAEAEWEAQLTPEQRGEVAEWQQYQATRPAVDPDADARRSMNGGN